MAIKSGMSMSDEYGTRLSHLEGQVGGLSVQISSVSNNMTELGHKIDRIVERISQKKETNWGWVLSAGLALGAFVLLYTSPLEKASLRQDAEVHRMQDDWRGFHKEAVETHARNNTRLDALERDVARIDLYGSRIWATKKHPQDE